MNLFCLILYSSLNPYSHAVEGTYTHSTKTRFDRSLLPCRDHHGHLHHSIRSDYEFFFPAGAVLAILVKRNRKQYW